MLPSHPIGVRDAANSSTQSGANKVLYTDHTVPGSDIVQSSRDGRDETKNPTTYNRYQNKRKMHYANGVEDDDRAASSSTDGDGDAGDDEPDYSKSLIRTESSVIELDGLSRPGSGTRDRLGESPEEAAARRERLKGAVRTLLECVGEDPDREGLLATPGRYAEALLYFTSGYEQSVLDIVNDAVFQENHNEMVVVRDIEIYSLCEHHLVPFTGMMHIGYIPANFVIGLSKLARIAEMFARRLQVQERLTKSVANAVYEVLQPQGVAVVVEAKHLCMAMRGVQKTTGATVTSCMIGCFETRSKTRNEFLSLIHSRR